MFKAEPARIFAILAAIAQVAVIFFTDNPSLGPGWVLPILTLIAGELTRRRVFSEQTVRDAGFTPAELVARAESPTIQPAVGK